jgi:hypothetical protein
MQEKYLLISGRVASGKTDMLIAYINRYPKKTLLVSYENTKEHLIQKGLDKNTKVLTNLNDLKQIDLSKFETICFDYIELIDKQMIENIIKKLSTIDIRIVAVSQMRRGDNEVINNVFEKYL